MGIWTVGMLGGMAWSFFRPESWSVPTRGDFEEESGVPRRYGLYAGISAIMFMSLCALLGTAWPWLTFLLSGKSVKLEEDFYNRALLLPAVIVLILSALVPFLGWHRTDGKRFFNRMLLPWTAAATLAIVGFFAMGIRNPFGLVVAVICFLTVTANAWRISEVIRRSRVTVGGFIAHMGVAILLLGMVVSRGFERKEQVLLPKNEPAEGLGFTITRGDDRLLPASTAMKQMKELPITFVRGDQKFVALPEYWQRLQPGDPNPQRMTRPWIKRGFDNDIYVSIRPPENVFDARGQVQISPGETKKMGPFTITRIGALTMKGQPGQVGTTFSAHFHVVHPTGSFDVEPALQMTEDGLQAMPQDLGQGIGASIGPPQGMNGPILFQLGTITDLLPVELFHKPLTILVWLGAGIMACGGFLSVRRRALDARALARQRALTSHEENGHPHASHPTSKKQNTPRKGKLHKSRLHRKY
jgi:cytochrome c-type biogenesis protein CcmF